MRMARSNLTEEEENDRFIASMVVSTDQVKAVPSGSRNYDEIVRLSYPSKQLN